MNYEEDFTFSIQSLDCNNSVLCLQKDNKYDELTHLAAIKLQEAIKFAENQPCKPVEEWRIDTISNRYVAVHPSFEREYIKLINEYKKLFEQAIKAYRPDKKKDLFMILHQLSCIRILVYAARKAI